MDSGSMFTRPKAMPQDLPLHLLPISVSFQADPEEVGMQISKLVNRRSVLWHPSAKALGFILAVSLGLLLITSACSRYRLRSSQRKPSGRRLAGGEEDNLYLPPSPLLEALCNEAGLWAPDSPAFGEGRASPQLVREFLRLVEEHNEETVPTATVFASQEAPVTEPVPFTGAETPGLPTEAPVGFHDESGDEQPGPSWAFPGHKRQRAVEGLDSDGDPGPSGKFFKLALAHQRPAPALPPSAEPPFPQATVAAFSVQVQGRSAPVSGDAPCSSTATAAPSGAQSSKEKPLHPFVCVPILQPGVEPRPWMSFFVTGPCVRERSRHAVLKEIRALLLQPSLDGPAAKKLMDAAELLANYAIHRLSRPPCQRKPSEIAAQRGLKFVVLDALHSAARAISSAPPPWWRIVVDAIVQDSDVVSPWYVPCERRPNMALAQMLGPALLRYRTGGAPEPETVIRLKRLLFCNPAAPFLFKGPEWSPWREDCDKD